MDGFGVLFVILSYFIPNHFLTYSNEAVSFILFIVVMITFISIKKLFNSNQNKMIQNIWQQSSIKNIIIARACACFTKCVLEESQSATDRPTPIQHCMLGLKPMIPIYIRLAQ